MFVQSKHAQAIHILLVIGVLYLPTIWLGFALDDIFLIEQNTYLKTDPLSLLVGDLWFADESVSKSSFFRPLFMMSIIVDAFVFTDPWGFHLHNILWHLLTTGMLYLLLLRWFPIRQACMAILIFGLHPLQSEVVIWISARNDSMAAFFCLLAIWLYTKPEWTYKHAILRIGIVICALLSKESVLFLPVIIGMLAPQKKVLCVGEAMVAMFVVILVRTWLTLSVLSPLETHWNLFWSKFDVLILGDAARLIFPFPLCATRAIGWDALSSQELVLGVFVLFGLLWSVRSPKAFVGIFCAFLFWVPTLWPTVLNGMHGDRYLYLPMAGIAVAIAVRVPWHPWMLGIVGLWIVGIEQRIPAWQNDTTLWSAMLREKPSSFSSVSLAHILYNNEEYQRAAVLYQEGYAEGVPYLAGCGPYVISVLKVMGPEIALEAGEWALQRGCSLSGVMSGVMTLGLVSQKRWADVEFMLEMAPPDPTKRMRLLEALIEMRRGRWDVFLLIRNEWEDRENFDRQLDLLLRIDEIQISYMPIILS